MTVQLDEAPNINLFVDVDLDAPVPCSYASHDTDTSAHEGDAEWMFQGVCDCGKRVRWPICGKWAEYLRSQVTRCSQCGSREGAKMTFTRL